MKIKDISEMIAAAKLIKVEIINDRPYTLDRIVVVEYKDGHIKQFTPNEPNSYLREVRNDITVKEAYLKSVGPMKKPKDIPKRKLINEAEDLNSES